MLPATLCPCPACSRPLDLAATHLKVPYRRDRWWHWGEQRSEYLCPRCGAFSVLRLSGPGVGLYLALAAGLGLGRWKAWPWPVLGLVGLLAAALMFRHAVRLVPAPR